jgi:hypothetical protein
VFWAWQSDLPGKVSRHFIKNALEEAIAELNEKEDIAEPDEGFRSGWVLNHDRKDVSGSPTWQTKSSRRLPAPPCSSGM